MEARARRASAPQLAARSATQKPYAARARGRWRRLRRATRPRVRRRRGAVGARARKRHETRGWRRTTKASTAAAAGGVCPAGQPRFREGAGTRGQRAPNLGGRPCPAGLRLEGSLRRSTPATAADAAWPAVVGVPACRISPLDPRVDRADGPNRPPRPPSRTARVCWGCSLPRVAERDRRPHWSLLIGQGPQDVDHRLSPSSPSQPQSHTACHV